MIAFGLEFIYICIRVHTRKYIHMDGGRMDVYTLQSECHHVRLSADQEAFILYSKYIYTHAQI